MKVLGSDGEIVICDQITRPGAINAFTVFGQSNEKLFATPDQAGTALLATAQSPDQTAGVTVFSPNSSEIISSGHRVQDKAVIEEFVRLLPAPPSEDLAYCCHASLSSLAWE